MPWAAAAAGAVAAVGSVASASIGAGAAKSAANQQAQAQANAENLQLGMWNQTQQELEPFMKFGEQAGQSLAPLIGSDTGNPLTAPLTRPFQPTMEELEKTPGYKFALDQGSKAVTNSLAPQGLAGPGGVLGKGLAGYAEGLASTTFQQQFGNYLTQNQQIYNMLANQENLGLSAAAAGGGVSTGFAGPLGSSAAGIGAAQAGGTVGAANALTGGINSATGSLGNFGYLYALNNGGLFNSPNGGGGGNSLGGQLSIGADAPAWTGGSPGGVY